MKIDSVQGVFPDHVCKQLVGILQNWLLKGLLFPRVPLVQGAEFCAEPWTWEGGI